MDTFPAGKLKHPLTGKLSWLVIVSPVFRFILISKNIMRIEWFIQGLPYFILCDCGYETRWANKNQEIMVLNKNQNIKILFMAYFLKK